MNLIAIAILAPLSMMVLILLLRRLPAALALLGAAVGLLASIGLLSNAFNGMSSELILPGLPDMPLRLVATPLTALLSTLVAVVSSLVLVYAAGYMKQDNEKIRFFATMLLFVSAMQTLVLAGDWILLLAAWELIGLSSYLLIGFWYRRPGVRSAATRAFLTTRSADLGLYIAVFILIAHAGSSDIAVTLNTGGNTAVVAGLLLLVAAMGKSAQTPLHDWLQRAMAGPTPVSALLHSATLVAAGAILLIRTAPMLPAETLLVAAIIGGITTVVTGMIALGERDLKRLLAASTSSQYGLMLVAVGAGVPLAALLHLIAHAAIKSSLFLGAGVFQHSRESTMLTELKGAGRDRPLVFSGFALAALALAGIPPLSGFFSKDAIIAAALSSPNAWLLASFALAGTLLTGAYMARALRILWRGDRQHRNIAGLGWMGAGLAGLVTLAVILGAAFPSIETLLHTALSENTLARILGLGAALSGLTLGWFIAGRRLLGPLLPWAQQGFAIAGGFDTWMVRPALAMARSCEQLERGLYNTVLAVGRSGLAMGRTIRRSDDQGIDGLIFSLVRGTVALGQRARTLQSGLIHREMAITVVGTALILVTLLVTLLVY
ncbi:NADH dehydrogenase subunit L [Thiogranum longum]|uniref:NADH dehydrogenase subunit L n=1 Tax=Thiogranum longum TaxID=1537524 RepID=A0A4R1HBV4_9GAMM|nr:proton-conducting transporter membrane subunit [Thiogranum longum]TCK18013.1 NADH dehydrogenase subunit L [Thiogranum longum]